MTPTSEPFSFWYRWRLARKTLRISEPAGRLTEMSNMKIREGAPLRSRHKPIKDPKFLLMYPPQQFLPADSFKPDGSLGLLYVAGTLRKHGYEVALLDACVGNERYTLEETFYQTVEMPNGLVRIGMTLEQISREIAPYDVIGITNLFTFQTSRVIEVVEHIKKTEPDKLIVLGGNNARHMADRFLAAGVDIVCLTEAESTILDIAAHLRLGTRDFSDIPGVAVLHDGEIRKSRPDSILQDLDRLAFPAWDMLPLQKYWELARPHGGGFNPDDKMRFASLITSRGCPFKCAFCHISNETDDSYTGNIARFRMKSKGRVLDEFDILQDLGVQYVFIEDDSLLAKKKRAIEIFREVAKRKLILSDINGVNIVHMCKPENGKLVADEYLFETFAEAGFTELTLPFESGSQRILDKYATGKLNLEKVDTVSIIRIANRLGITVGGNYTIGYPDETYDELTATIMLARRHMDEGMFRANFMCIVPFPGTALFDSAVAGGHFSRDFDPDTMNWLHPVMRNMTISADVLDYVNQIIWKVLNNDSRKANVQSMSMVA